MPAFPEAPRAIALRVAFPPRRLEAALATGRRLGSPAAPSDAARLNPERVDDVSVGLGSLRSVEAPHHADAPAPPHVAAAMLLLGWRSREAQPTTSAHNHDCLSHEHTPNARL